MYFFLVIITSAIVSSLLGALWYSKFGFQKQWMNASGITDLSQEYKPKKTLPMNFILECLIAWLLTYLVLRTSAETVFGSIEISLRVWFFVMVPLFLSSYIWERKSLLYVSLLSGHRFISTLGSAITIALFY